MQGVGARVEALQATNQEALDREERVKGDLQGLFTLVRGVQDKLGKQRHDLDDQRQATDQQMRSLQESLSLHIATVRLRTYSIYAHNSSSSGASSVGARGAGQAKARLGGPAGGHRPADALPPGEPLCAPCDGTAQNLYIHTLHACI